MNADQALEQAEARIADLEMQLRGNQARLRAKNDMIEELQRKVTEYIGQNSSRDAIIATLRAELQRVKSIPMNALAAQGVKLEDMPVMGPSGDHRGAAETPWSKYHRLLGSDPKAAGDFWAAHSEEIINSRPK